MSFRRSTLLPLFLVAAPWGASCTVLDQGPAEQSDVVPQGEPSDVLGLVNLARSEGRNCGSEGTFGPTGALGWNDKLGSAAERHALDMASHSFMSHTGSDGSNVADRVSDEGYAWSAVGENVAAGQTSPEEVMDSWLSSPGHCANIMSPDFEHMGIARAQGGFHGVYWAQTFGRSQ